MLCRNVLACQFNDNISSTLPETVENPLWSTGQAILQHYRDKLPPIDPEFADGSKLRVSNSSRKHSVSKWRPSAQVLPWNTCVMCLQQVLQGSQVLQYAAVTLSWSQLLASSSVCGTAAMQVLIAVLPRRSKLRALVNQDQVRQ